MNTKNNEVCPSCGYIGAVMYNPYNGVIQCHNCGYTLEKVYNEPPYLTNMQDGKPLPAGYVRQTTPLIAGFWQRFFGGK